MRSVKTASLLERIVKGPAGFRLMLERRGPIFVKIGQFLALRPDLIPQEYCDELMQLLDRVPPFSWSEAREILRGEFGAEPADLFASIEPIPIAAGSLAQVHIARLEDGTRVAVKIQRPNIESQVVRDLRRARRISRLLEPSGAAFAISPTLVVDELAGWLDQELDFTHELANLKRLYRLTSRSASVRVPRPYPDLSSRRVLTAEYLGGVRVSELLAAMRSSDPRAVDRVDTVGLDLERFSHNLMISVLRQIFSYQFFHADLHPGNLIALPGNVVGFVDFGLCDELDEVVRKRQLRYLRAVYEGDAEQMFRSLTEILIPPDRPDVDKFRSEFLAETAVWLRQRETDSSRRPPGPHSPLATWMVSVLRVARQDGYRMPAGILSIYRALFGAESVANQLGTRTDLSTVSRDFFEALEVEETLRSFEPRHLQTFLLAFISLLRDYPAQLNQILSDASEGRFSLNVAVAEQAKTSRLADRRFKLLTTAIFCVSVAVLLTVPGLPWGVTRVITGVLLLLYVAAAVQWYRL